jgi:hypothetical protein
MTYGPPNGPQGNGPLGLEHPLVVSHNLDALAERYRAMGFAPTRRGHHPWGTATQLVLFPDNFIELMGIEDRGLIDVPSLPASASAASSPNSWTAGRGSR